MGHLSMLLCGCIVDADSIEGSSNDGMIIIECPFCKDTFTLDDLARFATENKQDIRNFMLCAIYEPKILIKYREEAFEIVEFCDCGCPYVRRMKGDRKRLHLRVPEMDTVRLFN
jgi:hypothetical protein